MNSPKFLIHKSLLGAALGLSLLILLGTIRAVTVASSNHAAIQTPAQIADGSETHGVKSPPKRA